MTFKQKKAKDNTSSKQNYQEQKLLMQQKQGQHEEQHMFKTVNT